jgi:hypothetical protein
VKNKNEEKMKNRVKSESLQAHAKDLRLLYRILKEGVLINLHITKIQIQLSGFIIFLISYLLFFNLFIHLPESKVPFYAPGTAAFAILGYWLGGYIYDKYNK